MLATLAVLVLIVRCAPVLHRTETRPASDGTDPVRSEEGSCQGPVEARGQIPISAGLKPGTEGQPEHGP